jgi:hypothetical protein
MSASPRFRRFYFNGFISLLLGALALAGSWTYRNFDHDDAFITYRYARNLAQGQGLVYNIGERVLGTSTPLYTGLLALGSLVSGQPVHWISHLLCGLSLWLGGVALYTLGKSHNPFVAVLAGALYVSHPLILIAIGMETLVLNLLVMMTLMVYGQRRFGWTGIGLGLLILTRYETALFGGLLGIHFMARYKRWPLWLTPTVLLVGLWLAYAGATYGRVLPQSVVAKLAAPRVPFVLGALVWWRIYTEQTIWFNLTWVLAFVGSYALVRQITARQVIAYPLVLVWAGIYGLVAALFAGSFSWYYGPLIPSLAILMAHGADFVRRAIGELIERLPLPKFWASPLCLGLTGLIVFSQIGVHLMLWRNQWAGFNDHISDPRVIMYREVTDWLNEHAQPDDTLAAAEIGALGYYSSLKIIDLFGLTTPELTSWLAEGEAETLSHALALYQPNYVLIYDLPEFRARLTADYQLTRHFGNNAEYLLYTRTAP